jgi:NAD(P)-dependent dehydrogenase (short-subunit alcohol dehydrogenase family)
MRIPRPIGGKVVVITGAARGIGEALAVNLARRGARLALVGLEPESLARVAERCGPNTAWWECDVTDPEALARVVEAVQERFHRVDVLVANAGIVMGSPLLLADPVEFDRVIEVNLLGSVRTVRAFLPLLVAAEGYYLQIASLAAMAPTPLLSAYDAAKSGVEAFALALRCEVAHHGVDVGVAYLSFTRTDMTQLAGPAFESDGMLAKLPGPLGRMYELEPTVERLADGIERRSAFVYGQSFIRWIRPLRWVLPSVAYRTSKQGAAQAEKMLAKLGPEASRPIGAGGRADTAARSRLG